MVPTHITLFEQTCTRPSKIGPVARITSVRELRKHSLHKKGEQHVAMVDSQSSGGRPPAEAARRSRELLSRLNAGGHPAEAAQALQRFGQAVGRLRRTRGLSRKEVAQHSNLSEDDVILLEWGLLNADEVHTRLAALAVGCQTPVAVLALILQTVQAPAPSADMKGETADDNAEV